MNAIMYNAHQQRDIRIVLQADDGEDSVLDMMKEVYTSETGLITKRPADTNLRPVYVPTMGGYYLMPRDKIVADNYTNTRKERFFQALKGHLPIKLIIQGWWAQKRLRHCDNRDFYNGIIVLLQDKENLMEILEKDLGTRESIIARHYPQLHTVIANQQCNELFKVVLRALEVR